MEFIGNVAHIKPLEFVLVIFVLFFLFVFFASLAGDRKRKIKRQDELLKKKNKCVTKQENRIKFLETELWVRGLIINSLGEKIKKLQSERVPPKPREVSDV